MQKSIEYWLVLAGMALYILVRDAESKWPVRLTKTLASLLLTVGLSSSVAIYLYDNELLAIVVIMAFGLFCLDMLTALIQDRDFVKDIIKSRLGGGNEEHRRSN